MHNQSRWIKNAQNAKIFPGEASKNHRKLSYLILFFLLITFSAYAEPQPAEKNAEPRQEEMQLLFPGEPAVAKEAQHEEISFAMQFMNMLTTLGLLIALVFMASWVLKRIMRTRIQQANQTSAIKILEQRALTSKTNVSLIEIQGRGFVVAESANGVTLLGSYAINSDEELTDISSKGEL